MNENLALEEVLTDEEFEEDYNPFVMHLGSEPFHSFERLFQNHFDIKDNKWLLIPRSKFGLLKSAMRHLKKWHMYLKKEHQMIHSLLIQNESMKQKLHEDEKLISSLYSAEKVRISLVQTEVQKLKTELRDKSEIHSSDVEFMQLLLQEKDKTIQKHDRSIQRLNEVITIMENQNKNLQLELTKTKNELLMLNNLKKGNTIEDKPIYKGTTLELIMATKLKHKIVCFLDVQEYQNLLKTSRKLYLSMIATNIIVPHAVRSFRIKLNKNLQLNSKIQFELDEHFKTDDKVLKEIMLKQYDLKLNFTEFIVQALRETQSLIDGDNFTNLKSGNNKDLMEQLEGYLNQQRQSYNESLKFLMNDKFPWNEIYPKAQQSSKDIILQRKNFPNQSQMIAQQIIQRLYDLSSVCAQDSSIFGMFLTQLQRNLASLFVYSTHLVSETNQLQSLNYFLMQKIFIILKDKRKYQEQVDDLQTQLQLYQDAKQFLNNRVRDLELLDATKNKMNVDIKLKLYEQERLINQKSEIEIKNQAQIRLLMDKMKILANELITMRRIHKSTLVEHNQMVQRFQLLKNSINLLY